MIEWLGNATQWLVGGVLGAIGLIIMSYLMSRSASVAFFKTKQEFACKQQGEKHGV